MPQKSNKKEEETIQALQLLDLAPETGPTYETGAKFLAFLTYPKADQANMRSAMQNALCHYALRYEFETHPEENEIPITVKPMHIFVEAKSANKKVKLTQSRLGDRLVAGRMAVAFLKRAE